MFNVKADITCLGKIIGGGLPVGAYGGRKEIMEMVSPEGPMYQAGTLSGNPLAMSAGLATLKNIKSSDYRSLEKLTGYFVKEAKKIISSNKVDATINHIGSMFTIFFTNKKVVDYESALKCDTNRYAKFFKNLLDNKIMFPPSQFEAVFLSTSHTKKELDSALNAIDNSLKNLN